MSGVLNITGAALAGSVKFTSAPSQAFTIASDTTISYVGGLERRGPHAGGGPATLTHPLAVTANQNAGTMNSAAKWIAALKERVEILETLLQKLVTE